MHGTGTLALPINFPTDRPRIVQEPALAPKSASSRLVSLDAYRGFVMLLMASDGLLIPQFVKQHHLQGVWQAIAFHTDHVQWRGCSLWDLIQPSFTFIVGVALPFSLAKRQSSGQSLPWLTFHAFVRSLILIFLGIFLSSMWDAQTNFTFVNTLTQIGMGYTFAFLLAWTRPRWQIVAIIVLLVGYWLAFALWPLPAANFNYASVGVTSEWYSHCGLRNFSMLHPFDAHWDKNTNFAAVFDVWFMNLKYFPRAKSFTHNTGGYQTLSFIPTLATMLLGLQAGNLMKSGRSGLTKFGWLVVGGCAGLGIGWLLDYTGACPSVKRIWTPSWVLFSGGWACLLLAVFYLVVDLARWRWLAFPMVVAGMNSIAMYCLADSKFPGFIRSSFQIHLGEHFFDKVSDGGQHLVQAIGHLFNKYIPPSPLSFGPIIESAATLLVLWLICLWMYRRKIFLRI